MLTNQEPDWNIDDITDAEIYAAIRYLEPEPGNTDEQNSNGQSRDSGAVICVCLYVVLLGCLAFFLASTISFAGNSYRAQPSSVAIQARS